MTDTDLWRRERSRLIALAYRITGSFADSEDAVSEAWMRLASATGVTDPAAWLTTVTARVALDIVRSPSRARTDYIGPWLPDVVDPGAGPDLQVEVTDSVNRALVRMLQELSPVDRVLLVLSDVAGYTASEIATIVDLTPAAVRQRLSRARRSLSRLGDDVVVAGPHDLQSLAENLASGNLAALTEQLSEGCVLWTDANGTAKAALRPVIGRGKVTRFLAGIVMRYGMPDLTVSPALGGAVLVARSPDMVRAITVELHDGRISGLQVQQNQAKIRLGT